MSRFFPPPTKFAPQPSVQSKGAASPAAAGHHAPPPTRFGSPLAVQAKSVSSPRGAVRHAPPSSRYGLPKAVAVQRSAVEETTTELPIFTVRGISLYLGSDKEGLQHIQARHAGEFKAKGINDIPKFLEALLNSSDLLFVYKAEYIYNVGGQYYLVIVGSRKQIVTATPVSIQSLRGDPGRLEAVSAAIASVPEDEASISRLLGRLTLQHFAMDLLGISR